MFLFDCFVKFLITNMHALVSMEDKIINTSYNIKKMINILPKQCNTQHKHIYNAHTSHSPETPAAKLKGNVIHLFINSPLSTSPSHMIPTQPPIYALTHHTPHKLFVLKSLNTNTGIIKMKLSFFSSIYIGIIRFNASKRKFHFRTLNETK